MKISIIFLLSKWKLKERWTANPVSDLYYYVLEGNGHYSFEDERIAVAAGDLVYIPKNTKYRDEGNFTVLGIATPRFNSNDTIFYDEP